MNELAYLVIGAAAAYKLIPKKPQVQITAPSNNQVIKVSQFPTFVNVQGTSNTSPVTIEMFHGTILVDSITDNSPTFSASLEVDGPGPHTIKAHVTDSRGNRITQTVTVTFSDINSLPPLPEWGDYHGVNWAAQLTEAETPKFMKICADNGFNLLRVDVYWQTYENNPAAFESRLRAIITEADKYGIACIICNHQWHIGGGFVSDSAGFPARYVKDYPKPASPADYDESQLSADWWRDAWDNNLRNGLNLWADLRAYLAKLVEICDSYENVIGYEILNEPRTTAGTDYAKIGSFNAFMASHLNGITQKKIVLCRDNGISGYKSNNAERSLMLPDASNLVYSVFAYRLSAIDLIISQTKAVVSGRNIPVLVSEWATDPKYGTTIDLASSKLFLENFKAEGFAHTYWAFGCWACQVGKKLVNRDGSLNAEGVNYSQAVKEVYS